MIRKTSIKSKTLALMTGIMIMGASFSVLGAENTCGKNAKWTYNEANKELTISGSGYVESSDKWENLKIKKLVVKSGITGIKNSTFSYLRDLEKVSLPKSVKYIGNYAFEGTAIKNIEISDKIKKVGDGVFSYCDNLENVVWNYKYIPESTFYDCDGLKTVKMGDKVKKIDYKAFAFSSLESIDLSDSLKSIGEGAFYCTKKLKSIDIPENVKTIEKETFYNSGIENIKLNDGLNTIKESAFEKSKIKSIVIPDSVSLIETKAFVGCKKLETVKIGEKLENIDKETFDRCKKLSSLTLGKNLKTIGESAFNDCKALGNIEFPSTLETIDYGAFKGSGLTKVDLSKYGKYVDYWAFSDCDMLESIKIGAQVEEFHVNAVANCKSLKNISIDENNAEYVSDGTCIMDKSDDTLLLVAGGVSGTYKIPKDVFLIDSEAFYGCVNIKEFDASENPRYSTIDGVLFRERTYENIRGLELVAYPLTREGSYSIPKSTIVVAASAFQNSKITAITIPNTVRYIGACAFEECKGLTRIVIPGSVEQISNSTFWGCDNLVRVQIKKGVKYIRRNAFKGCEKLKRIEIPKSVMKIAKTSFKGCSEVTFYCKKSSYAMSYANTKWFIKYKII